MITDLIKWKMKDYKKILENYDFSNSTFFESVRNVNFYDSFYSEIVNNKEIIKGLLQFVEYDKYINLYFIEVSKEYRNRGVGSLILDELKNKNKPIITISLPETSLFYIRNGFRRDYTKPKNCYVWVPSIIDHSLNSEHS